MMRLDPVAPGGAAPLGISAKSPDDRRKQYREARYKHLASVAKLMPGVRTATCQCGAVSRVEVVRRVSPRDNRSRCAYRGVETCGSVWICPVCSAKISEVRRLEMNKVLAYARTAGYAPFLLTLTHQHNRYNTLKANLAMMKAAKDRFVQLAAWRVHLKPFMMGNITATEVTYSDNAGWHVHFHVLVLLDLPLAQGFRFLESCRGAWSRALAAAGGSCNEHGFSVQSAGAAGDYVAKWGAAEEMALSGKKSKGGLHPFGLLAAYAAGDERAGALFQTYAYCFAGRRQLVWSRGLKALAGLVEVDDAEVAEASEGDVICTISRWLWRVIVRRELRAQVLDHAEGGDLAAYLSRIRRDAAGWVDVAGYRQNQSGFVMNNVTIVQH